ncbi:MAG: hypothetical protein AUJ07_08775 [Crenarchaeota archaeon 13_1_40CM_3_53_5]|nr:MAG: hypothetical protein AUJ07_08775 [Crenarchaeota archaeon 13_1_40CM_3_53_5]
MGRVFQFMRPTISVVMPTRGRGTFVSRAISTVLKQTYEEFELLIVDNSPPPDRECILEMSKSDPRIRFVDRGNIGVTDARRLGALLSRGRLLALLDSDDYWDRERLEKHVQVWKDNRIGLSWDRWAEVSGREATEFPQPFSEGPISGRKVAVQLHKGNFIHASAGIVLASFAKDFGFPVRNVMSSDWMLFMRAAEFYPVYFVGDTLSFKELESPDRVSDTGTQEFFSTEGRIIRRWALIHNPRVYARQYLNTRLSRVLQGARNRDRGHLARRPGGRLSLVVAKKRRTN